MVAGFLPCDPSRVARKLGSLSSGDSPKYGSGHQARTSRIVEVVEPTNELASGIQPRQRRVLDVEHPSRGIDLEATEGEIGRATWRESVCQYVLISVVAES